jgi:tetraacyldisaccharide 4'-kinase
MRNKFFSAGILRSTSFDIPVICVGNLSAGGTGKTPHTEYIAELLFKSGYKVAILSRGYKRKTKGFLLVEDSHSFLEAGDEPCQYKRHFPDNNIIVAVDEKRRRGIQNILRLFPEVEVIILDDAFQHRYVKAGLNILLTDYYKPFFKDRIFPLGNLREPRSGKKRAHVIIVTKSPPVISPLTRRHVSNKIKLQPDQSLFFSKIIYGQGQGIFSNALWNPKTTYSTLFLLTGIANPYPLQEHLRSYCINMELFRFPDHHIFSVRDIQKLLSDFNAHLSSNKIIVTTEKDMIRLHSAEISNLLSGYPVFYIPIKVEPDKNDTEKLNNLILNYVGKNKRNN